MNATIFNATVASGVALFAAIGSMVGVGTVEVVTSVTSPPPPRAIIPVSLHWNDETGEIGQLLRIEGGPVKGEWAAAIWRDGRLLCSGGDSHPYDTRPTTEIKWLSPSKWTGDECPELQPGDKATAVWEWVSETGALKSASIEFIIPERTGT